MIRVVAAVLERDGKVLIGKRRSDDKHFPNKWEFPGGKRKDGETDEEGLRREMLEECGLSVVVGPLICSNVFNYKGIDVSLFLHYCESREVDIASVVHDEMKWVRFNELKKYDFLEANIPLLPVIQNYFTEGE